MPHLQRSDQETHGAYGPHLVPGVDDDSLLAGGDAALARRAARPQTKHSEQCRQWRSCFDDERVAGDIVAPDSSNSTNSTTGR